MNETAGWAYRGLFSGGVVLVLGACSCPGQDPASPPSSSDPLRNVKIDENFTFQTTHAVTVEVGLGPKRPKTETHRLQVVRADGGVLFNGALPKSGFNMKLALPTKDRHVELRLQGPNGSETVEVRVVDGRARHVFE